MIGYACSNLTLQEEKGITPARTCRISTLEKVEDPKSYCVEIAKQNLRDTLEILKWNKKHNIKMYRMSASMFPFATHRDYGWELENLSEEIEELGRFIRENKMRVSSHLPQFINLGSPNKEVVEKSVTDLEYHTKFFDLMQLDSVCKIIIHCGGIYGNREKTEERFIKTYNSLSENVKNRLVIENDEKSWTILQLMKIRKQTGMTLLIDYLHWQINHEEGRAFDEDLELALSTWKQGEKPKIHYSEQNPEKQAGAHSIYVKDVIISDKFDTMVEAKGKELAILPFIQNKNSLI